jgi:threonyl-tRNA synthetase
MARPHDSGGFQLAAKVRPVLYRGRQCTTPACNDSSHSIGLNAGLIEHYNGAFPVWLAPSQVRIIPIADRHIEYAKRVEKAFRDLNLRVETDARPEKVGYKIREAQLEKVPYMIIVGDKEVSEEKISVRSRSEGDLGQMAMEEFTSRILKEISERV